MLYQLNGVSMYSSTNTEEMWNFVKSMGFENLENRFISDCSDFIFGCMAAAGRRGKLQFDQRMDSGASGR